MGSKEGGGRWRRVVAQALLQVQLLHGVLAFWLLPDVVRAQVVASPQAVAGQRPIIDAARNGVPIVHVAPPTAGGVSRNQYKQLDVGSNGLILNNSSSNVQSQLGGWIVGNPQLGRVPARVIVNEVVGTGSGASLLRGPVEVAGRAADVVISNSNGLVCDGCSFINVPRATLTTGLPRFDAVGALQSLEVREGVLSIERGGLDASGLEQLDLLARGIVVGGTVWADRLSMVAGVNDVGHEQSGAALRVTPSSANGVASMPPRFAIDITAFGAAVGNQVFLLATEKGLGVNSTGRIAALQGNLKLSGEGLLTIGDVGASGDVDIKATGDTRLGGLVVGGSNISVGSGGALTNTGSVQADGAVRLAGATLVNAGEIAGLGGTGTAVDVAASGAFTNSGAVYGAGNVKAAAATLVDHGGTWQSARDISFVSGSAALTGTRLAASGSIDLAIAGSSGDLRLRDVIVDVAGPARLSATGVLSLAGSAIRSSGDIIVSAARFDSEGSRLSALGRIDLASEGAARNAAGGAWLGGRSGGVSVVAGSLDNSGGTLASEGTLTVKVTDGPLLNDRGVIYADGSLRVSAGMHDVRNGEGTIGSHGSIDIVTSGALVNDSANSVITADQDVRVQAGSIVNGGRVEAARDVTLLSGSIMNPGRIEAGRDLATAAGSVAGSLAGLVANEGRLAAGRDVVSTAGSLVNRGVLEAGQDVSLLVGSLDNRLAGSVAAGRALRVSSSAGHAAPVIDNRGGVLSGATTLDVAASSIDNGGGKVVGNGVASLTTLHLDNRDGVVAAQQLDIRASAGIDNTRGALSGGVLLGLDIGSMINRRGSIIAGGPLVIDTSGAAFDNAGGIVNVAGDLTVRTLSMDNRGGSLWSGGSLALSNVAIDNTSGRIESAGAGRVLRLDTGSLVNDSGSILSAGQLSATVAGSVSNAGGAMAARDALALQAVTVSNHDGTITSERELRVVSGAFDNARGSAAAGTGLDMRTGTLANGNGVLSSTGALSVVATGDIDNTRGSIMSGGTALVAAAARALNNTGGRISSSEGDLRLDVGMLDNRGGVTASGTANGRTIIDAGMFVINDGDADGAAATSSRISGRDVSISTRQLSNKAGIVSATGDLAIDTRTLDNTRGELSAGGDLRLAAPSLLNTAGSILAGERLELSTATSSWQGLLSAKDMVLSVSGAYRNDATLQATHDLSLTAASIDNAGLVAAGRLLRLDAQGDIINGEHGELSAGSVSISAGGRIDNRGLINASADSGRLRVAATHVANTGRVYGADVELDADTIENTGPGVIAARESLLLKGKAISNTGPDALLLSLGAMNIEATSSFTNTSGRVEASGDLLLSAPTIRNLNGHLETTMVAAGSLPLQTYVIPDGTAIRYPLTQCSGINERLDQASCIVHPESYGKRSVLPDAFEQAVLPATGELTTRPRYGWNDPIFLRLKVASVPSGPPIEPGGKDGCWDVANDGTTMSMRPECVVWRDDVESWNVSFERASTALQAAIDAYNAVVNEENRVLLFEDYTVIRVTPTTTETRVIATEPGQILSGGSMVLDGTSITNADSRIVAGGMLMINGRAATDGESAVAAGIRNISTPGQRVVTFEGTSRFTWLEPCHHGADKCRSDAPEQPHVSAPETSTFDPGTTTLLVGAATLQGGASSSAPWSGTSGAKPSAGPTPVAPGFVTMPSMSSGTGNKSPPDAARVAGVTGGSALPAIRAMSLGNGIVTAAFIALAPPATRLFIVHKEPGSRWLVEADPAFTSYKTFIGSEYFAERLGLDPLVMAKRYGDGFTEQRLVDDQVLALTGRRYLSGYQSTEDEFTALMDAGVAFAEHYRLSPGVALDAAQMALLTSDIVWLVETDVTLADGSSTKVVVPQVYLRRLQPGNVTPEGSLIAGQNVLASTPGDLVNTGAINGGSVSVSARDVDTSSGGKVDASGTVLLRAANDLRSISGSIRSASGDVTLAAGRDVVVQGAALSASGNLQITAGRDVSVTALRGSSETGGSDTSGRAFDGRSGTISSASVTQTASLLQAGGNVFVSGRDVVVSGSDIVSGGNVFLTGTNVSISAARASESFSVQTVQRSSYAYRSISDEILVGGKVTAGGSLTITARGDASGDGGNVVVEGANIVATGQVLITASNDVKAVAASTLHTDVTETHFQDKRLLERDDTKSSVSSTLTQATGTSIGGASTAIVAGNDLTLEGARVQGREGVLLAAGRDLSVVEARSKNETVSSDEVHASGFAATLGGLPVPGSTGDARQTTRVRDDVVVSVVGSSAGTVRMEAGGLLTLQGAQVSAAKDIAIKGGDVRIVGAMGTESASTTGSSFGTNVGVTGFHKPGEGFKARLTESNEAQASTLFRSVLDGQRVTISSTGGTAYAGASGAGGAGAPAGASIAGDPTSTGNIFVAGTTVNAESLSFDPAGTLYFGVQSVLNQNAQVKQGRDLVWQKAEDRGSVVEKAEYNHFNVASIDVGKKAVVVELARPPPGSPASGSVDAASASGGTDTSSRAQTPPTAATPTLQQSIAELSVQPGMAWIGALQADAAAGLVAQPDWRIVQSAADSWDHGSQGLTPEGAAIVTVVVAWASAGAATSAGSAFAASATGSAATAGSASVLAAATTAALTTLAAEGSVALLNNQGDIGGALHDMGSSANVKSLIASIITAGVIQSLNVAATAPATTTAATATSSSATPATTTAATSGTAGAVGSASTASIGTGATSAIGSAATTTWARLQQSLTAGAARAVVESAIYGSSLEDNLKTQLKGALIDAAAGAVAEGIGSATQDQQLDAFANKVAHAIAGCAAGAAKTDTSSGCGAGALGATVGELSAELRGRQTDTVQFAAMVASVAAAVTGEDITVASAAASNAAANNFLKHDQAAAMQREFASCKEKAGGCSDDDVLALVDKYRSLSNANIDAVNACIVSGDAACVRKLEAEAASAAEVSGVLPFAYGDVERQLVARQNNAAMGSLKGTSSISDAARAEAVANYKAANCGAGVSVVACAARVNTAMKNGQLLMSGMVVVALGGSLVPVAADTLIATATAAQGMAVEAGLGMAAEAALITRIGPISYCLLKPDTCAMLTELAASLASGSIAPSALSIVLPAASTSVAIPKGFKPYQLLNLPPGSIGVVEEATGELRVLTAAGKLVDLPPAPIPAGITAVQASNADVKIVWDKGIREQGIPFEDYLETQFPPSTRLPPGFDIFDFRDVVSKTVTSVKTLNTMTESKYLKPTALYSTIKGYVDKIANAERLEKMGVIVDLALFKSRELQIAVPAGTTALQWDQIGRAVTYAKAKDVIVKVTVVSP